MQALLKKLKENNVKVSLKNDDLMVKFKGENLPEDLIKELKDQKQVVIQYLQGLQVAEDIGIEPAIENADGYYPLTSAQSRIWVLSQFELGNVAYNMRGGYELSGSPDTEAFLSAFKLLIARHEILRTAFRKNDAGNIMQVVISPDKVAAGIKVKDLRKRKHKREALQAMFQEELVMPFDLETAPLIRATLYRLENEKYVFTYVIHHIISDGWSMEILIQELMLMYNAIVKNEEIPLAPLRIQYKDYAVWVNDQLKELTQVHKIYWLDHFSGEVPVLELSGDRVRPAFKTYNGGVVYHELKKEIVKPFKDLLTQHGSTLFMGLLAVLDTLLYRYTGQEDITIGTTSAGRDHNDLENQIGLYLNTLALRTKFNGTNTLVDLLENIKQVTLGAYEHQVYPFEELVSELNIARDLSRNPLFDVMLILQNTKVQLNNEQQQLGNLSIRDFNGGEHIISKTDVIFDVKETGDTLRIGIEYNSDIYDKETIVRLGNHFEQLLVKMVAQPELPLYQHDYLSVVEKEQLLINLNEANAFSSASTTTVDLFEAQVEKNPKKTALIYKNESFTYSDLNEEANRLANYLRLEHRPGADELIGIKLPRSQWTVVAILAILKTGAAYVPIDTEYPEERIRYILNDSKCKIVIDEAELNKFQHAKKNFTAENAVYRPKPRDLAYVIYTSGSTGYPKGVMIEHANLNSFFANMETVFGITPEHTLGAGTNFTFDISVLELLGTLVSGVCVHLFDELNSLDFLSKKGNKVDVLQMTPSKLNQLIELDEHALTSLNNLKVLLIGGEAWSQQDYEWLKKLDEVKVINVYGPTETTIWSSSLEISTSSSLSIGTPLLNEWIYITDSRGYLVPVGVPGEICIGGTGVGRGYWNNAELSANKFVADPFSKKGKMYKTGDVGKRLTDGTILFQGRVDNQLKIRGNRIELEEVKRIIQLFPGIDSVAVVPRTDGSGKTYLAAYFVSKETCNIGFIRKHLSIYLPVYMIPDFILQVESFPLTSNGKLDTKKLPVSGDFSNGGERLNIAPETETEKRLLAIWQSILGKNDISISDSFFDLGGHSLKITRLAGQIYKDFEVKLPIKELFINPVLKEQASLIDQSAEATFNEIAKAPLRAYYPISAMQRRLWVQSQFEDANSAYNLSSVHLLEGSLNKMAIDSAFRELIIRHESFRTIFREIEEGFVSQVILPFEDIDFKVNYKDYRNVSSNLISLNDQIKEDFVTSFDLTRGPLLRVGLYQVLENQWAITLTMHHIISDAWSMKVLTDELFVYYNAFIRKEDKPYSDLRIQYKDYSLWQQNRLSADELNNDRSFWLKQFDGEVPVLQLPGYKGQLNRTYNSKTISKLIDPKLLQSVRILSQNNGSTLYMSLLSAVNVLLYRYTNQNDITIGSPVAGRDHIDLERQIGFYVNTLALRTKFNGEADSFNDLLEKVKTVTVDAYQHQHYPFDELVAELNLERDNGRNPLFDIEVILQNIELENIHEEFLIDLEVKSYEGVLTQKSVFDAVFNFIEEGDQLRLDLIYNSDVYDDFYISHMTDHLEELLKSIVAEPTLPLNQFEYLKEDEKLQLIKSFNDKPFLHAPNINLVDLFRSQARKTPDAIAVSYKGSQISYQELDEKSDQLAGHLKSKYLIEQNDKLGIMLERSDTLMIAILGALKAGGAFVPIDVSLPKSRKEFMFSDCGLKVLISQSEYILDLDFYDGNVFAIDIQMDLLPAVEPGTLPVIGAEYLAYIIYTSGSTGTPKGVMVNHVTIANSLLAHQEAVGVKEKQNLLQFFSPSFDAFVFEVFIALLNGATLHVYGEEKREDTSLLQNYMADNQINLATFAPAYLPFINADQLPSLETLISGGEQPSIQCVSKLIKSVNYINAYGPTETCVIATTFKLNKGAQLSQTKIPIGSPIPGVSIYILDSNNALVPVGVVGEIYIGGKGLAQGYLNNPDMTTEKFVSNPFNAEQNLYKTGDLGSWLPDGTIEFCGRKDDQMKIRGYRIEAGEIQKSILSYPGIQTAVVSIKNNKHDEKELVGYLVGNDTIDLYELRRHIKEFLPSYMIPSHFVQLDKIPLTPNGKVDTKQLPEPGSPDMPNIATYMPPTSQVEQKLIDIWMDILDKEKIGIQDNFFDLGGHSLKAIRMLSRIKEELLVNLKIDELFNNLTIETLAKEIEKKTQDIQSGNILDNTRVVI